MNFETRFNKGDVVWFMKNNKPTSAKVTAIEIFYVDTNQDRITYNAIDTLIPVCWLDHSNLHEKSLYPSKEDLIKSL